MANKQVDSTITVRVPLVGSPTNREYSVDKDQRFVNCFPEYVQNNLTQQGRIYLTKRFGTQTHIRPTGTNGEGRGIYAWNGKLYSVIGNKLYENTTLKQTLTTSTGAVGFVEAVGTNDYLVVVDGSKGYTINTSGTVATITDVDFPTPHVATPVFMDGYVFLLKTNGDICNSDLGDPTSWSASNFITAESFPDGTVCIARQNNQVVALGQDSIEFFYDAANATGSPLAVTSQATLQFGCASAGSVAQEEGLLVFVAESNTGGKFVVAIDGFKPSVISTDAIERILDDEGSTIVDCWGMVVRQKGHMFYVLCLPSTSRTLVYDMKTQMWHEWSWDDGTGAQILFPMVQKTELNSTLYMLHQFDGYIYKTSETLYQDAGYPIQCLVQTSRVDMDSAKVKFMARLELIGDRQTTTSNVSIRYTDDDYKTWSTARTVNLQNRSFLYRLGQFRRRAFLLIHSANTQFRVEALEFEVSLGIH